jgi:2-C-methyl-D-erythritol 2,4-cyclodiphosphate synthase
VRIGIGYDIHKLVSGRKMVIGGVEIPFDKGPEGHSDGDVLLHAVCDALLGALGRGDIGMLFPDTDPEYKDYLSIDFLKEVFMIMKEDGYKVKNIDCVVIAEEPKISVYKEAIIQKISEMVKSNYINVKGKTSEKLGIVGEGNAIEAYAVALLEKK